MVSVLLNELHHVPFQDPIIIDVSGPHSKPPANIRHSKINKTEQKHVIHLRDHISFSDPSAVQSPASFLSHLNDDLDVNSLKPGRPTLANQTGPVDPDEPITLYVWRHQTGPNRCLLNVLPSASSLKDNEICTIKAGNRFGLFGVAERQGLSALYFTRTVQTRGKHSLELTCLPVRDPKRQRGTDTGLEPFTLRLHVNIL